MQYLLMLYSDESGWKKMTKAEQEQGMAAYMAYTEALKKAGALVGSNRLQPIGTATTVQGRKRQATGAGWAVCGFEGAAGRLLSDRRARSGRGDRVGGAVSGRESRHDRSAADLGDGAVACTAASRQR